MKKMNIVTALILSVVIASICLFANVVTAASTNVSFQIDHLPFTTPDGEPEPYINKDNRTLVPIRFIANALGVSDDFINWDFDTKTATIMKGKKTVKVVLGQKELTVDGKKVAMDTKAEMKQNRVFLPARFIAEALGARVEWDDKSMRVFIMSDPSNNLPRYGYKLTKNFPVSDEGKNGLKVTVNEVNIYPIDSAETKTLKNKFSLYLSDPTFQYKYVIWIKVTLENKGKKEINTDENLMAGGGFGFRFGENGYAERVASEDMTILMKKNNPEFLHNWSLKPGEKLTSYISKGILVAGDLGNYAAFSVSDSINDDITTIAIKP